MTRKEFEKLRISIEEQDFFAGQTNPIDYGIQRAAFEKRKFKKLIAAARRVNFKTAQAKAELWQRQLERAEHSIQRFKELRKEIEAATIQIIPAENPSDQIRPQQ